jgi:hypothetical protein
VNHDTQLLARPRNARRIWITAICVVVLAAAGVTAYFLLRSSTPAAPAASTTPVVNGITRPDATCVTTDGTDHQDYWNGNGWWAGRIDGEPKEMPALNVLALKLKGHQINSAWICAPRSNG